MICFSPPVFSHVLFQCRGPSQRKLIYAKYFMMGLIMLDRLFDSKWNNNFCTIHKINVLHLYYILIHDHYTYTCMYLRNSTNHLLMLQAFKEGKERRCVTNWIIIWSRTFMSVVCHKLHSALKKICIFLRPGNEDEHI